MLQIYTLFHISKAVRCPLGMESSSLVLCEVALMSRSSACAASFKE